MWIWKQLCLAVLIGTMVSCGNSVDDKEITHSRLKSRVNPPVAVEASSAERLRLASVGGSSAPQNPFHWTTPEGWHDVPSTSMRMINFHVASGAVECYLSALPGSAGGVEANVNRWRGQMGLAPYSAEEFAELPRREVLDQEAVYVAFDGTFTGMGDTRNEGYRMVGAIFEAPEFTIFAKMVGEAEAVRREEDNFGLFLESLHFGSGHDHGDVPVASDPAALPEDQPFVSGALPDGHPDITGGGGGLAPVGTAAGGFAWDAPEGWTRGPDRTMRLVTYTAGRGASVECYVTVLSGMAGGTAMNINRWRNQMGQGGLSEEEIGRLRKITILGKAAPVVEVTGAYSGMGSTAKADFMMVGAVSALGTESVFIKMIGPESDVREQLTSFIAFCESLRRE